MISFCLGCGSPSNSMLIQLRHSQRSRRSCVFKSEEMSRSIRRNSYRGSSFEQNMTTLTIPTDNDRELAKSQANIWVVIKSHVWWTVNTFSVLHSIGGEMWFDSVCRCRNYVKSSLFNTALTSFDILRAAADCKAPHVANPNSHFASRNLRIMTQTFFFLDDFVFLGRRTHLCLFFCLAERFMQANIKFISHTCDGEQENSLKFVQLEWGKQKRTRRRAKQNCWKWKIFVPNERNVLMRRRQTTRYCSGAGFMRHDEPESYLCINKWKFFARFTQRFADISRENRRTNKARPSRNFSRPNLAPTTCLMPLIPNTFRQLMPRKIETWSKNRFNWNSLGSQGFSCLHVLLMAAFFV